MSTKISMRKVILPTVVVGLSLFGGHCLAALADEFRETPEQVLLENSTSEPILIAFGGPGGCPPPPPGPGGPGGPDGPGGPGMHMPPPPFGGPPGGHMGLPLHDVDLSDEQVEKLAAVRSSARDKADPIMLKLHSLEREFVSALAQPTVNVDEAAKLRSQINAQKQLLDVIFSDSAVASAQILTPEQRKQIKSQMNRMELGPAVFKRKAPDAAK